MRELDVWENEGGTLSPYPEITGSVTAEAAPATLSATAITAETLVHWHKSNPLAVWVQMDFHFKAGHPPADWPDWLVDRLKSWSSRITALAQDKSIEPDKALDRAIEAIGFMLPREQRKRNGFAEWRTLWPTLRRATGKELHHISDRQKRRINAEGRKLAEPE